MENFDNITYDDPAFLLITFLLHNNADVSLRSIADMFQAFGIKVSHTTLQKKLDEKSKKDFDDMYLTEISAKNVPQTFKKKPKLCSPKPLNRNCLSFLDSKCVPRDFLINMLPNLENNDLENLERILKQKVNNSKNSYKCKLDIVDVIIMCAAFRLNNNDKSDIWETARHINFCRLGDAGEYSIENAALRTNIENCSYAQKKFNREKHPAATNEHDKNIKTQIARQLEFRRKFLSEIFFVISVEDRLIVISEYENGDLEIKNHEKHVLEVLTKKYEMQYQHVWCRMRNGRTLELYYVKTNSSFKECWLSPFCVSFEQKPL